MPRSRFLFQTPCYQPEGRRSLGRPFRCWHETIRGQWDWDWEGSWWWWWWWHIYTQKLCMLLACELNS